MGLRIIVKITSLIISFLYMMGYKKSNKLEDYIDHWGWLLLAILL